MTGERRLVSQRGLRDRIIGALVYTANHDRPNTEEEAEAWLAALSQPATERPRHAFDCASLEGGPCDCYLVVPQPATEPARPWLPMDPDPNAVKVAPGTWLHHGLYLRGQPATEPALDETARAINKAIDYLTDGDTVSTSEGRVAAARATLIAARLAAQPPAEVERLRADDDGSDPWGDVWDALDRLVPSYPEDDDDMGEIRRIVSQRQDARAALAGSVDDDGKPICNMSYLCPHHTGKR